MLLFLLAIVPQFRVAPASPTGVVDPALAPPAALQARACGNDVTLTWQDVASAESGFVVLRRDLPAVPFHEIAVIGPDVTQFNDVGAANGVHVYAVATRGLFQGREVTSPPSARARVRLPNSPPVLSTDLPADLSNDFTDAITFHVTAVDPEGDPVTVRLLNPQDGMVFTPLIDAPSPAALEVRWRRDGDYRAQELPVRLVFETSCGVRLEHDVRPARVNSGGAPVVTADVTGDGTLDAIAIGGSPLPSPPTSLFVFAGSPTPSGVQTARLQVAGEELTAFLHGVQCADMDGDGTLDVVARSNTGTVHIWRGGPGMSGTPAPTASLQGGSSAFDLIDLVDLDGDEQLDVLLSIHSSTVGGHSEAGSLSLWYGASGYSGVRTPDRVLTAPAPATTDLLGNQTLCADVTGDGALDILTTAKQGVFVWESPSVAAGVLTPRAILTPGSSSLSFREIRVAELSGDGVLDVLRGNHLWHGGPGLSGTVAATATLNGQPGVELSTVGIADLNADGTLDVLLTGALDFGQPDTGGFYLWAGGGPTGTVAPTATLSVPGAASSDLLNHALLVDLDQDDELDVLAYSIYVDGPVADAGALYVWYGGAGMSGTLAPAARLGLADASLGSELTFYGVEVGDLDVDGELDVVAGAPWFGPGAIHVFRGSGRFAGSVTPSLSLTHATSAVPHLWYLADVSRDGVADLVIGTSSSRVLIWKGGPGLLGATGPNAILTGPGQVTLHDWNEDGIGDLVAAIPTTHLAVADAGTVALWYGGAALAGTRAADVTLSVAGALANDRLGQDGLRFADWTGDGRLDLLAVSPDVDSSSPARTDCGALYLWNGLALTTGATPVAFTAAISNNFLGRR